MWPENYLHLQQPITGPYPDTPSSRKDMKEIYKQKQGTQFLYTAE